MRANTVRSLSDYIKRRLMQGPIVIRYKDDPDHTTKKELKGIVHGVSSASEEDLFGALTALCDEGVVVRKLEERDQVKWGSQPDPKKTTFKIVTYVLA